MVSNPFEADGGRFYVLVNDDRQYSLWPSSTEIPAGWLNVFGAEGRRQCLDYVREHWADLRPKSPRDAVAEDRSAATAV